MKYPRGRSIRVSRAAVVFLVALSAASNNAFSQGSNPNPKLNVLFIAVDDLNCRLGCYSDGAFKTPHIDKLASRGVRFDRAYCQYPLCNPSRTSLLSGRRPETTLIRDNTTPLRKHLASVVLLPEHFQQHGYFTARLGKIAHGAFEGAVKWGNSPAEAGGTETGPRARKGGAGGGREPARPREKRARSAGALKLEWGATGGGDEGEPDGRTARAAVKLLEESRERPFFIAAGFHRPHIPFNAPKKYFDLYPPEQTALPRTLAQDRKDIPSAALTRTAGDDAMTDDQKRQAIAAYDACISFVDAQVGVILDALDRLELTDRTIVIFFGDHGFHLGEHGGLWRKLTLFEESARSPLIIAAPGKRSGAASKRLVELVDLYPTLAELCGLPQAEGMEGASLAPLLDDPGRPWKQAAFTEVDRGNGLLGRSVRTERFRYTEWGGPEAAELYDHDSDPLEQTNLARDPAHTATVSEMRRVLEAGWRGAGARSTRI